MAFALVGYVTSMVTALYRPKAQHYPMPAIAQASESGKTPERADNADVATSGVAEEASERLAAGRTGKKLKEAKLAQDKKLKMLARQRDQQQAVAALGYGPEPSDGSYGPFGVRRY